MVVFEEGEGEIGGRGSGRGGVEGGKAFSGRGHYGFDSNQASGPELIHTDCLPLKDLYRYRKRAHSVGIGLLGQCLPGVGCRSPASMTLSDEPEEVLLEKITAPDFDSEFGTAKIFRSLAILFWSETFWL